MSEPYSIFIGIIAGLTLLSSGIGVFVSLKAKSITMENKLELATFHNTLMRELDDRYVRRQEHNQERDSITKEEALYRCDEKAKIESIKVDIYRDRENLNIILKDILAAVKK